MSKIGIVTKFEITRQLKKKSFWISLILLPLLITAIVGFSALSGAKAENSAMGNSDLSGKTIGLTNDSPLFSDISEDFREFIEKTEPDEPVTIIDIKEKSEGTAKISDGSLDIYYYLPADLAESLTIETYSGAKDASIFTSFSAPFSAALKTIVISRLDPETALAISDAIRYSDITLEPDGSEKNLLGEAVIPLAILAIFYLLICVFGSRLVTALTEEKENRISEMILTTISPKYLVIGKIISLISLGFLQIAVLLLPAIIALVVFRDEPAIVYLLSSISVNPWSLVSNIILLLFSYFFFAGACTLVSALMPTARDANNYVSIVIIGVILPLFFIDSLMAATPTLTTYVLTYFPLSAPLTLMFRNAFGILPSYELILGLIELVFCSALVIFLTIKAFSKNAINFSAPNFSAKNSLRLKSTLKKSK